MDRTAGLSPARRRLLAEDVAAILSAPLPWQKLDGKAILVTGAGGFLGSYMVETLLAMRAALGCGPSRVIGLVRTPATAEARFAVHAGRDDFTLLPGSVEDPPAIEGPVDVVVHAASQASPRFYLTDPVGTMTANLTGTMRLLELARAKGGELLFFSSGEVYGETDRVPTAEADYGFLDPAAVRSCYGESKRAGETMCVCWTHQHGIRTTIVRPFHTYGPGVALDDGRVFADFVADIVARRDIVMKSDGLARRAFCYVADAVEGFFQVLLTGAAATPYNIGNPDAEISIRELGETLVSLFPARGLRLIVNAAPRSGAYATSPIARNVPAIDRARDLGWVPRTGIRTGFERMVLSYE